MPFGLSWFVICLFWPSWSYPISSRLLHNQAFLLCTLFDQESFTLWGPLQDLVHVDSWNAKRQLAQKLHMPQPTRKWRALPGRKRPSTISSPTWKDIKDHQNMFKHFLVHTVNIGNGWQRCFFIHIDLVSGLEWLCRCEVWIPKTTVGFHCQLEAVALQLKCFFFSIQLLK